MDGNRLKLGFAAGAVLGVVVAGIVYTAAPPIQFPGEWSWLNSWGRLGVALAAGWFTFVLCPVLAVFSMVAQRFNEMGGV